MTGSTVFGVGERLVRVGPYPVDITPEGHLLLISQLDKPGIIGHEGTLPDTNDINIASMQVGRKEIGCKAVMILQVDKKGNKTVIEELYAILEIKTVREINFD